MRREKEMMFTEALLCTSGPMKVPSSVQACRRYNIISALETKKQKAKYLTNLLKLIQRSLNTVSNIFSSPLILFTVTVSALRHLYGSAYQIYIYHTSVSHNPKVHLWLSWIFSRNSYGMNEQILIKCQALYSILNILNKSNSLFLPSEIPKLIKSYQCILLWTEFSDREGIPEELKLKLRPKDAKESTIQVGIKVVQRRTNW